MTVVETPTEVPVVEHQLTEMQEALLDIRRKVEDGDLKDELKLKPAILAALIGITIGAAVVISIKKGTQ